MQTLELWSLSMKMCKNVTCCTYCCYCIPSVGWPLERRHACLSQILHMLFIVSQSHLQWTISYTLRLKLDRMILPGAGSIPKRLEGIHWCGIVLQSSFPSLQRVKGTCSYVAGQQACPNLQCTVRTAIMQQFFRQNLFQNSVVHIILLLLVCFQQKQQAKYACMYQVLQNICTQA